MSLIGTLLYDIKFNLDFNNITNEAYIYRDIKPNSLSTNKLEYTMLVIVNDIYLPKTANCSRK
ncbi:hypothetical protein JMUB7465_16040 [Staphylococcus aureus]|nr:hypothetical protein SANO10_1736 [Staphylococcus aureus]BBG11277.1 hypothetical protein JMUB3031_1864 [Staphylococcus aureus]BCX98788.1 hypothetical protein SA59458_18460 [Staphylococcus aureus]BEV56234.1 hypothetical protein JARBOU1357_18530 [Staphylococcus aureus]